MPNENGATGAAQGEKKSGSGGASCNLSVIIGNVGAPPEWKQKEGGNRYCVYTVGVSRGMRVGREYKTLWYRVTVWGTLADRAAEFLVKGQQVQVYGRMTVSEWTAEGGEKRYTHEISASDFQMLGDPTDALFREAERLEREAIEAEGQGRAPRQ